MTEKSEKMVLVAETTMKLLSQHGLGGVTFTRVARSAGVSRAWLYKYIGNTDDKLVEFTIDTFGLLYARLDMPPGGGNAKVWMKSVIERFATLLDSSVRYPWVMTIYFRYRGTLSPLGKKIGEMECAYLKTQVLEIQKSFKISASRASAMAEILLGIRMGLAHRWVNADLRKVIEKDELIQYLRVSLLALVRSFKKVPKSALAR